MSQAYGFAFAMAYNHLWADFATRVAPAILEFYETLPIAQTNRRILDVCCGTGQLARYFLEKAYQVTCLDLSLPMLKIARKNNLAFALAQQVQFVQGDGSCFGISGDFGLAVSTYDALNHLSGNDALRSCFESVSLALAQDGVFIFDLNTRHGLSYWNGVEVIEEDDLMVVRTAMYEPGAARAWMRLSGFVKDAEGLYQRFSEVVYNTVYEVDQVLKMLTECGFAPVYPSLMSDLSSPLDNPEEQRRVFFVAYKR